MALKALFGTKHEESHLSICGILYSRYKEQNLFDIISLLTLFPPLSFLCSEKNIKLEISHLLLKLWCLFNAMYNNITNND